MNIILKQEKWKFYLKILLLVLKFNFIFIIPK